MQGLWAKTLLSSKGSMSLTISNVNVASTSDELINQAFVNGTAYSIKNENTFSGDLMSLDKICVLDANDWSKFDSANQLTMSSCTVSVFRQIELQTNQAVINNKAGAVVMGRSAVLPIQQPINLHIGRKELFLLRMMSVHHEVICSNRFLFNQWSYNFAYNTCLIYNLDYNHCNFDYSMIFNHYPVKVESMSRTMCEYGGTDLSVFNAKHYINCCLLSNVESKMDAGLKSSV